MAPDDAALVGLLLGAAVLLGTALSRRTGIPDPVTLVLVGLAASLLPGTPVLELPPEVVFLVFLPPLVFRSSFLTDPLVLRRIATPLALLSVGLVLATAVAVAGVVSLVVPGLSFAEGLVLGAVVAPTDTVAPAAVFRRLGAPRFVVDLVEGESLINDATALVLYAAAVDALVNGPPTAAEAALRLVLGVAGGLAVGAAVGALVLRVRRSVQDVGLQLLLSLFTPYAAYVAADRVDASGVLAVVVAGLMLGRSSGGVFGASARLQTTAFWSLLELLLNAGLFVLLGLQVRGVLDDRPGLGAGALVLYATVTVLTVVLVRLAWQFVVPPPTYALRRLAGRAADRSSHRERLVIGWTGMRGAISLAAALALPAAVEDRPLLLFLTVSVVMSTLVLQGMTLPVLLRVLGLADDTSSAEQARRARLELALVALRRIEELEQARDLEPEAALAVRQVWEQERLRLSRAEDGVPDGVDAVETVDTDLVELRLDLARAQGEALEQVRRTHDLPMSVVNELQEEIDLQRVRLARSRRARRPGRRDS